jgi:Zn-dependent alcohol dehydrogenase
MSSFTAPKSYTAYAFKAKGGNLEKISVDWKDPQQGEIIVKVIACGVCARCALPRTRLACRLADAPI